jgi:hypothetical protein
MASLFRVRTLLDSFPNRNVVGESTGIHTNDGNLVFRVSVDFGIQGKLSRYLTIKALGNELVSVTKAISEYESSILEIIDILEEMQRWVLDVNFVPDAISPVRHRGDLVFNRVLCEENPLMAHAAWVNKSITCSLFGKGLYDMEIRIPAGGDHNYRIFEAKITSVVNIFREHLRDIEKLPVGQLLKKGAN